jgi:hypothetical protein
MATISLRVHDDELAEIDWRTGEAGVSRTALMLRAVLGAATADERRFDDNVAEASAASTLGSPWARTRNVALCARTPAMPDVKRRFEDTLGLTPERVPGVPPRGPEM